jgi:DNA-binding CsgD family transcriptional regulator
VYEEARSRWRLAEALLAHGRRDQAEAQARAAHGMATRLRAEPLRAEVDALARRGCLDLGGGHVEAVGGEPAGLTRRELEVLRLVAAGRSNQQIADAPFISRKTASVHVSNILGKLGVHTRIEAAATAHRLGLDEAAAPAPGAPVAEQHRLPALSNRAGRSCGLPAHHRGHLVVLVDDQNVQSSVGSTVRSV